MNKAHRSLWNASLGAWVAVSENSRARGKKSHRTAALTLGAASLVIASMSAFAGGDGGQTGIGSSLSQPTSGNSVTGQGGTGGAGFPGTAGAGGAPGMNGGNGQAAPFLDTGSGGGGGGGSTFLGTGPVTSTQTAGSGGNGGFAMRFGLRAGAGGGGGGGSTIANGDVRIEAMGALIGGNGGVGGNYEDFGTSGTPNPSSAGMGGGGGAGLLVVAPQGTTTTVTNAGLIIGGNGGSTGTLNRAPPPSGQGARGGAGEGTDAGAAAASFVSLGGTGIVGSNLNVINSGTISGGFSGDGSTQASAIRFTGGTNRLELRAGSQLNGNVLANGSFDTLAFGGTESGAFNMADMVNGKFQGFEAYEKTGSSTWTLTGDAYDMTITGLVREGTLRLGDGDGAGGLIVGVDGQNTPAILTAQGPVGQNGGAGTVALAVSGGKLVLEDEGYVRGGAGGSASTTQLQGQGISSVTGATGGAAATGVTLTGGTLTVESGGTAAGGRGGSGGAVNVFSGGGLGPVLVVAPAVAAASMSLNVVVGAGGAGGSGVTTASGETIVNSGSIVGGGGGRGGGSQSETDVGVAGIRTSSSAILVSTSGDTSTQVFTGTGGAGGNGGHGVLLTGTGGLQNNNFIRGGHGGDAGSLVGASLSLGAASSTITNAAGGTGGAGVAYTGAGSLVNEGELRGGDGGVSSLGAAFAGFVGMGPAPADGTLASPSTATVIGAVGASGGAGIYFGGAATVENRGLVQGGTGAGVTPPPPDFMAMVAPSTPTQSFALATSPQGPTTASATGNTGGTGGSALVLTAGGTANNRDSGELYGGTGGNGSGAQAAAASLNMAQASAVAVGGNGGNGGNGASLRGVSLFLNEGSAYGGRGGDGGSAKANSQSNTAVQAATLRATGGNGGTGGAGIAADDSTVVNRGTVQGGNGGLGATAVLQHENIGDGSGSTVVYSVGTPGAAGAGGAGITGSNLQVTNAGSIVGGLSGDGATLAPAIAFTGGVNSLTIERSSAITGLVLAHSTADTLALGGSDDSSFDVASAGPGGQYRGFGQFRKSGDATWTLTGSTTQVTPWTIAQGTLVVGADASLGDASGALTLAGGTLQTTASMATARAVVLSGPGGTLRTDTGTTLQIGGQVSGSGALTKDGSGTLRLSAANSYTGGTRIAAGTLIGGANSFGTGAIVNDSALVIDQPTDATMVNDLSGKGSLTKAGAGAVRYTGNGSAFTGSLQVTGGVLSVNGSLGGTLNIESGSTLKGSGSVGSTVLASGATVAPGNSIGTLTVNGDFTFAPGSRYQVETDPSGASDLLRVTGTATLGGASVIVLAADGKWSPTTTYTILTSGTRVGTFGSVSSNFAFLDPALSYKGGDVLLSLVRNTVAFPTVGITLNQRASGAALDSLGGGLLYNAVVQLDAPTARLAFDQLSGELHASVRSALIEDSRFVREAGADRLRQTQGGAGATGDLKTVEGADGGLWTRAYGSWGDTKGDGNAAKAKRDTRGVLVGADRRFGDWRLGVLGGAGSSSVSVDDRQSSAKIDSYHLGLYGGTEWGALALRTGASYTHHSIDTRRRIAFTGLGGTPEASYNAGTTQVFGELGWRMDAGTVALEPFANLAHVNLRTGGFTERASLAGLSGRSESGSTTFTTLGLRASTKLELGGTAATLRGMLGWRHAFGDVTPTAALAFMGGNAFTVTGVPVAKNAAVVEAGLDFAIKQDLTLGVSYNGQFGSGVKDHGLKANLLWKF